MALEKTFRELSRQLRRFRDRLLEMRLTVVEDRPETDEPAIVDDFEDAVEDLRGWLEEALAASTEAGHGVGHPLDLQAAQRSLGRCREQFERIEERFSSGLASYEKLDDLNKIGRERTSEWGAWSEAVRQGIEHCRQQIEETGKALTDCWQEIAEHVGTTNVSISTTNIGQKIVTAAAGAKNMLEEEVT